MTVLCLSSLFKPMETVLLSTHNIFLVEKSKQTSSHFETISILYQRHTENFMGSLYYI